MNHEPCFYHPKRKAAHKWVDGEGRTFEVCGKCFRQIKEDVATKNVRINAVVVELTKEEFAAVEKTATGEGKSVPDYLRWLALEIENELTISREVRAINEVELTLDIPAGTSFPASTDEGPQALEEFVDVKAVTIDRKLVYPKPFPRSKHSW